MSGNVTPRQIEEANAAIAAVVYDWSGVLLHRDEREAIIRVVWKLARNG